MSKAPWYEIAQGEKGVQENPDPDQDNPRIVEYFGTTDFWNKDDDEAWCSAFANWCFAQTGIQGTLSARARSWQEKPWGEQLDNPRDGCLVVMKSPLNPADPVRREGPAENLRPRPRRPHLRSCGKTSISVTLSAAPEGST